MVAGCGPTCVKYTFFTFNFLVFLSGGAILGVALWAKFDNSFQSAINLQKNGDAPDMSKYNIVLYVIMGVGALLILCGGLGCLGACCESPCLLVTFFAIILILFLAEIAAAIYIFVQKDAIKEDMRTWYKKALVDKYWQDNDIKNYLDETQKAWDCCGASSCTDYGIRIPDSCKCVSTLAQQQGCVDKFYDKMKRNMIVVAIVALAVIVVELLAMIFSCILCSSIRRY